jgi:alpha-1,3-rhamnosyl/mannosyltransferase
MRPVLESAAAVLVPSEATAGDLEHRLPGCRQRIHVVAHGCDHLQHLEASPDSLPEGTAALGSFFLAMGTLEPRKNWERVLRAFESAAASVPDANLVFAGTPGWLHEPFLRGLETSPLRSRIRLLTGVDDRSLAALYSRALALVYPSLWEGFGLPVAEAMSLGCPVVTSDRSALPETAGGAALLVDPESVPEIAAAMIRLHRERSLREDLSLRGRERAGGLTWERAATATLEALRESLEALR